MTAADDAFEAARIVIANAKRDPINYAIMPAIGLGVIYVAWRWWHVPWPVIRMFLDI